MIEYTAYCIKIFMVVAGALFLFNNKLIISFKLLAAIAMITGAELITPHDQPWVFLLSAAATTDDYIKATAGAALLLALSFIYIMILFGNEKIIDLYQQDKRILKAL